jgi:2'-5' RNA ligase
MKRLFIAVDVRGNADFNSDFDRIRDRLSGEGIKWTKPENTHITLVFLGDTDESRINVIGKILEERCTGFGNFGIVLRNIGVFRNLSDARIIRADIQEAEKLKELNSLISNDLKKAGFTIEDRPFSPHLTIGRVKSLKDRNALKTLIDEYRDVELQRIQVENIILYESILKQSGPEYRPVSTFKLQS